MGRMWGHHAPRYSARYRGGELDLSRCNNGVNEGAVHIPTSVGIAGGRHITSLVSGRQPVPLGPAPYTLDNSVATTHTDY